MPRVSEAHRRARRDEIAHAAVRVLARSGVSSTSIAQIVTESGLSAGAIYANFENKAELAQYVAQSLLDWRIEEIDEQTAAGAVRTPAEVLAVLLSSFEDEAPPLPVILQFWGEATTDPDLHRVMATRISELRAALARAVQPWATRRSPADAEALAQRVSAAMVAISQGYLANTGLLGWLQPDEYLAAAAELFADR